MQPLVSGLGLPTDSKVMQLRTREKPVIAIKGKGCALVVLFLKV